MLNTAALERVMIIELIRELSAVTETEFQVPYSQAPEQVESN
jgi:hypothetical protein